MLLKQLSLAEDQLQSFKIIRRSVDARSRMAGPKILLKIEAYIDEGEKPLEVFVPQLQNVSNAEPILIIGAGPAGLFAALKCIALGKKPVILERGKDVRSRRRDLAAMNKAGIVNPDSNYCFGEGGAGTYSDGKLYTRSTKRGNVQDILDLFIHFGATPEIGIDAHPHIGTNKLPAIIIAMREAILACGGEVHFDTKVNKLLIRDNAVFGAETTMAIRHEAKAIILATGHSARDIYEMLHQQNILIEQKPFALGVRIEHPQQLIDSIQYNCSSRGEFLPPASYSLVTQATNRGVFSFCMCPGGIIAPAATAPGEIVVNGWSPSKRNNPFANSGTVVTVDEKDFAKHGFQGPLAGLNYQRMVEQNAFMAGGGMLVAPGQRMTDFINGKTSNSLPRCSYLPGVSSTDLSFVLPQEVHIALKEAIIAFGKKMKGYFTNEALLVATESRTSSPVRIPRDKNSLMHPQIKGLYPCAEGAGYAGGIVSAAIDGERCAEMAVVLCREKGM